MFNRRAAGEVELGAAIPGEVQSLQFTLENVNLRGREVLQSSSRNETDQLPLKSMKFMSTLRRGAHRAE